MLAGYARSARAEVELGFARAGILDPFDLPFSKFFRLLYALLVDGLDKEQRDKVDGQLDGASTARQRREAMRAAGVSYAQQSLQARMRAASTPEERAQVKADALREAMRQRNA